MKRRVLAFGSFDLLHPGHISYLANARRLGTELIVVVARDSSIRMFKGRRPLFGEGDRLRAIGSLRVVDRAILGNRLSSKDGMYDIVRKLKPDVIAVGYDQTDASGLRKGLAKRGIKAKVVVIPGYKTGRYKSSKIKRMMGI
ncbi:MAG: FAD synthase [Candidatus Micrarchaeota archaeon]|nr:FAD synthase [Candidatus Micrarchaeota archaeon]